MCLCYYPISKYQHGSAWCEAVKCEVSWMKFEINPKNPRKFFYLPLTLSTPRELLEHSELTDWLTDPLAVCWWMSWSRTRMLYQTKLQSQHRVLFRPGCCSCMYIFIISCLSCSASLFYIHILDHWTLDANLLGSKKWWKYSKYCSEAEAGS